MIYLGKIVEYVDKHYGTFFLLITSYNPESETYYATQNHGGRVRTIEFSEKKLTKIMQMESQNMIYEQKELK